jgi:pimeloyl-ACP methyl ester carboxylesterase
MRRHADDCAAVVEHLGGEPVVAVGQSMGGLVAVALAATRPDHVERLVLVDGGLPMALPDGDLDEILDAVLGPSIARLRQTFPSWAAYLDFWRPHPALSECWNDDVEAYLRYDLGGTEPELRSRAREDAVREDGADTLRVEQLERWLEAVECPIGLLRAERDVMNRATPLLPDEAVAPWREKLPQLKDEVVPDTNHFSVAFGETGAKTIAHLAMGGNELR